MYNKAFNIDKVLDILKRDYGLEEQVLSVESAVNILNLDFFTKNEKAKYGSTTFFSENYQISDSFKRFLLNETYKKHLIDVLNFGLLRYGEIYKSPMPLKFYEKYSRKDVCRLLNWPHDDSSTMYGYRVKHNTCPIFVTYHKDEDISQSTKYEDQFMSKEIFSWMTRSKVKLESREAQAIINHEKTNLAIHLFIKKSDDEGKDFYYMGQAKPIDYKQTTINNDKGEILPIVNFKYKLECEVTDELYSYFVIN